MNYSYIDDIVLFSSSTSIRENILLLQQALDQLLELGVENTVKFDLEKTELIHFFINNKKLPKKSIIINNKRIEPKKLVRWLGVYFDTRLTFRDYISLKLASAERAYYRLR